MSKIQDALDKIKASQEGGATAHADFNRISTDSEKLTSIRDDVSLIQDMEQPAEMTPREKARARIMDSLMADRKAFNAFRDFRTSVLQKVSQPNGIIMVTSCVPGSGGSFVALNLAASIAMDESKTSLLIDCNLQNPDFSDLVVGQSRTGLKDYLKGNECAIKEIIHPTGLPRMRLIPVGQSNAPVGEYFTSIKLRQLFADVKSRYDHRYIIVDAPPVVENADARILAQVCDYVVLVVPYGKVTDDQIISAARAIGKDKLLGTVFNNQPRTPRLSW